MFNISCRILRKLNLYYSVCTYTPPQQLVLSSLVGSRDLRSCAQASLSKPSYWPGEVKDSPVGRGRIHVQATIQINCEDILLIEISQLQKDVL